MTYRMIIYRDTFIDYLNLIRAANSIKNKLTDEYRKLIQHIKDIER